MAAGDIAARSNSGMADLQALLATFKGSAKTTVTSKEDVSVEKANAYIQNILESTAGLSAVSSGQKAAGLYGSSTNTLLTNDLLARTAANAAALSSTKTQTSQTGAQANPIKSLAALALNKVITDPKGSLAKGKKAYSWLDDLVSGGGGGVGDSMSAVLSNSEVAGSALDTNPALLQDLSFMDSSKIADGGAGTGATAGLLGAGALTSLFGETSAGATAGGYVIGSEGATWGSALAGTEAASAGSAGAAGVGAAADTAALAEGATAAGSEAAGSAIGGAGIAAVAINDTLSLKDTWENGDSWQKAGSLLLGPQGGGLVKAIQTGNIFDALGPTGGLSQKVAKATGWIICTELNKQGRLPNRFYYYGAREFAKYDERGKQGYYIWAIPSVKHLRKYPGSRYSKLLERVFNARAEYLSAVAGCKGARKTMLGAITTHGLYAFCWILSRTIARASYSAEQILGDSNVRNA